ncbi:VOC family protein, partial [Henriciella sp.]|uniref:VOC family protein n=1 Tax=Henriciella sp. TaxID=1968823 RepID=UPI0025C20DE3
AVRRDPASRTGAGGLRRLTPSVYRRPVRVAPPGAETALLLAKADGPEQSRAIGQQTGGRVGFFLEVSSFDEAHKAMSDKGVEFLEAPRHEPYGSVAVFCDAFGNRWDLIQSRRS